jgi:hypothetical protein
MVSMITANSPTAQMGGSGRVIGNPYLIALRQSCPSSSRSRRQTPNRVSEIMVGTDPAARHPTAPALVRARLHRRPAKCRSPGCGSPERDESIGARFPSPSRSAKYPYVESLLAKTRVHLLHSGRSSAELRESVSGPAGDALQTRPWRLSPKTSCRCQDLSTQRSGRRASTRDQPSTPLRMARASYRCPDPTCVSHTSICPSRSDRNATKWPSRDTEAACATASTSVIV